MKISTNGEGIEFKTEAPIDHFKLGRLSEKLGNRAYNYEDRGMRSLEVSISDLIELVLK